MRIAVTGAAGDVGRETLAALDEFDITALTHREHDDMGSEILEITDRGAVVEAIAGHDIVVHLAANPSPHAEWDDLAGPNIEGTQNVYRAAVEADADRVVFASTNHVHQAHVLEDLTDLVSLPDRPHPVRADDPFCPDSFYGVTKVTGESLGQYFADRHGITVINLRIGWLLTRQELRDYQREGDPIARFARALWLSPRDCRHGIRSTVTESPEENPLNVNLISDNRERYFSILEGKRAINYHPQDDAASVVSDPDTSDADSQ